VARSPAFYFGTVIFFIGLLLFAVGVSKIIAEVFDVLTFAELISGIVMMAVGYRATSRPQRRESQPKP
jgi:membrane-bound ClpP family serine protease